MVSRTVDIKVYVLENLFVSNHPISVEQHHKWSVFEQVYDIFGERVIQRWRLLEQLGHLDSFTDVKIHHSEGGNREKKRQSDAVQEGHEHDVQN